MKKPGKKRGRKRGAEQTSMVGFRMTPSQTARLDLIATDFGFEGDQRRKWAVCQLIDWYMIFKREEIKERIMRSGDTNPD